MNERIKQIRKLKDMTQQEFADKIGTSQNVLANWESGRRNPSAAAINNICKTFEVSETWLRTGEGEMFQKKDTAEQFSEWADKALAGSDADFKSRFVHMLMSLSDREWKMLEQKVLEIAAEQAGQANADAAPLDVAAAEAAYIKSSRSAQKTASSASNTTADISSDAKAG